ncbi:MAG: GyrI-like domain-containing protein [Bacteroidetes bacterium]|nr:MAG: GyrI-like domain-containing protein [Bacteroidota bacterium]
MNPRIEHIDGKKFIGMQLQISLMNNRTRELFSRFMPRRKEILHPLRPEVYDLKIYPEDYFLNFDPQRSFTKWAAMEVGDFAQLPAGMQSFELVGGKYAVFTPQGNGDRIFEYIFTQWLPASSYRLDNRPHFDVLQVGSRPGEVGGEEIWVPVK